MTILEVFENAEYNLGRLESRDILFTIGMQQLRNAIEQVCDADSIFSEYKEDKK